MMFYMTHESLTFIMHNTTYSHRQHAKNFEHPYPYLYENMTDWDDYEYAFCPPDFPPDHVKQRTQWCARQQTHENGTLAIRFERFVKDYDGISPWDLVSFHTALVCEFRIKH